MEVAMVKNPIDVELLGELSVLPETTPEKSLSVYVNENKSVLLFLQSMGIVWSLVGHRPAVNIAQSTWNIIIRCGLLLFMIFCIVAVVSYRNTNYSLGSVFVFCCLSVAIFLQCLTLWLALYDMHRRLSMTVAKHYADHLNSGLRPAYIVLAISLGISILPTIWSFRHTPASYVAVYVFGEFSICSLLAASMYFVSTDCAAASSLLDGLIKQQQQEQLTFEEYSAVRVEVSDRQSASRWISNSIVFIALLDIAVILIILFAVESHFLTSFASTILYLCFLVKEFPFLFVVYWQVAQVNEKSAKLLKQLATTKWTTESAKDVERMSVYINAQGSPIVMSLAGMKLKRKNLAWQFALWCFAFVISSIRAALISGA